MSTGKIELSVGAVKYVDPNEIITEEEYNYIKNKVPELDGRVGVIDGEIDTINNDIEEINLSLDNIENEVAVPLSKYNVFEAPKASNDYITDEGGTVLPISDLEFLEMFYDKYLTDNASYSVKKQSLGKDQSGEYDIFEYTFTPKNYSKTILLSSGMHPWELPASFGLARFIEHLMEKYPIHAGFEYLKNNVQIKVIPIVNPWGFNQSNKTYGNSRGVNINRNFDSNGLWATFPTDGDMYNNKGDSPFSEAETQILKSWADNNSGAYFWIDCHTGMNNPAVDNWVYYFTQDPKVDKVKNALAKLENRIREKYSKTPTKTVEVNNTGLIRGFYALEQLGMSTITVELANKNWGNGINNNSESITEYEVALATYIFEYLDIQVNELKEFIRITEYNANATKKHEELFIDNDIILLDTFNRDNQTLNNSVCDTGQVWLGDFSIRNKKAIGLNRSVVDIGISDNYKLSTKIKWNSYSGIYLKYSDVTNNFCVRINSTGINLQIYYNGEYNILSEHLFTPVKDKIYNLEVIVINNTFFVYLDNVLVINYRAKIVYTGTKVGMRVHNDQLSEFENFTVKKITSLSYNTSLELLNNWSGSIECNISSNGLISLCGNVIVGNTGKDIQIAQLPTNYLPKTGSHIFSYGKPEDLTVGTGLYVASNGGLYLRTTSEIATSDNIVFNTVFQV